MASRPSLPRRRRERGGVTADVLDAARRLFLHYGVNRTTMADVARELGMPRQTIYEFVSSREELVDAVLVARIKEIAAAIMPVATNSFGDALVEASVAAINKARNDHELMNIVATGSPERVQEIITGPNPEIHAVVADLLAPILDEGLKSGLLRTDQSRESLIDWIRIFYLTLITQRGLGSGDHKRLVSDFLLPSVMFSRSDKTS